jgi:hypothetical protein
MTGGCGDTARTARDEHTAREQGLVTTGPASAGSALPPTGRVAGAEEGDGFELAAEFIISCGATNRREHLDDRLIAQRHQLFTRAIKELVDDRIVQSVRIVVESSGPAHRHLTVIRP